MAHDDHDEQLTSARAAFRTERDAERVKLAAERVEVTRLQHEAQTFHTEATRNRDRTKRLAVRYARHLRQKWADVRTELDEKQNALDETRGQFSAEVVRFNAARSEFHASATEVQDRHRTAWAELEAQRKRLGAEWTESHAFIAKQESALAARSNEFSHREQTLAGLKSKIENETASLRLEAAGLEARATHARGIVEELETKRDELHAELLAAAPIPEVQRSSESRVPLNRAADRDLTQWVAELDAQDRQQSQEKVRLAAVKASLDREAITIADQRKVLAEQFSMLGAARSDWQDVETRTVAELEDLARALRLREDELADREDRLAKAEVRRREDSHDLWRLRLRMEAWQSKLLTVSQDWHAERERRERDLTVRARAIADREATLQVMFDRWEQSRESDRERLQAELQLWTNDRAGMAQAAEEYERRSREMLGELAGHAARALASEDLLSETATKGKGTTRRFAVLRKRWEQVFTRKLVAIDARRTASAVERARLDERYQDVQRSLKEIAERENELNDRAARTQLLLLGEPGVLAAEDAVEPLNIDFSAKELAALRAEFERMAHVLLEPGAPEEELPWASEEVDGEPESGPDVLPFAFHARAA